MQLKNRIMWLRYFQTRLLLLASLLVFEAQMAIAMPLVDVEWLKHNLVKPDLVVLDIRSPNSRGNPYAEGHIPGARFAPYSWGWRERRDGLIGMLPAEGKIVEHIRSLGVNANSHVVIVPHGRSSTDFGAATRVYWTFKMLGHTRISILDGGYKSWLLSNGVLTSEVDPIVKGDFSGIYNASLLSLESDVHQSLQSEGGLIDARPVAQYEGRSKSAIVSRAGTIPGAYNIPHSKFYDARSAKFASRMKITEIAAELGLANSSEPFVAFCNTGHWASLAWFAFYELKGDKNISLYDGSMTEWARRKDNPVQLTEQ